MSAMRKALFVERWSTALTRFRNDDVIKQVAHLLESGRWHVCQPVMRVYPIRVVKESGQGFLPVPRRAPRKSEAPPPPPPELPEAPTLPANADQAAMAASMKTASELGIPFCEECFKEALRRSAVAAVV